MVRLPQNEKQTHRLNSWPQTWPSDLTLAVTLTLNFQGEIWIFIYLNQNWPDSHETKSKDIDLNSRPQIWPMGLTLAMTLNQYLNFEGHMNLGHLVTKVRCKDLPDNDWGDFRCRCAVDSSSFKMILSDLRDLLCIHTTMWKNQWWLPFSPREDNYSNVKVIITRLIWTTWTPMSAVPIKLNHSHSPIPKMIPVHMVQMNWGGIEISLWLFILHSVCLHVSCETLEYMPVPLIVIFSHCNCKIPEQMQGLTSASSTVYVVNPTPWTVMDTLLVTWSLSSDGWEESTNQNCCCLFKMKTQQRESQNCWSCWAAFYQTRECFMDRAI